MKWILNGIGRLRAGRSEQSSDHEPITPADQTVSLPNSEAQAAASARTEAPHDLQTNELKDVPGVTERMLVAFAQHGIKSVEDLAACATDDLDGWSESKDGQTIRHRGILDQLSVSRQECEVIIMNARTKAGWIK
jgi:predicted flap endonuclease-1-like 5' DNA nuclease